MAPELVRLLQAHGYIGAQTLTAPRAQELKKQLEGLAAGGQAPLGSGGAWPQQANALGTLEEARWGNALPADFQRAGAEIYRSIRAEGCTSVRDWLSQRYSGSRTSSVWTDLWTLAASVDFGLRTARSEREVLETLGQNDVMELALRRLAAYMYESRTGDRVGAAHMLGTAPPGTDSDVAPTWLVSDATAHSKAEYQRAERAQAAFRQRRGKGKGREGKGDKGKGKGGGGAGHPPAAHG